MSKRLKASEFAQKLVQKVKECEFDCGDHRIAESDVTYMTLYRRSRRARQSLLRYIARLEGLLK